MPKTCPCRGCANCKRAKILALANLRRARNHRCKNCSRPMGCHMIVSYRLYCPRS